MKDETPTMIDREEQRREEAARRRDKDLWPYSKRPFDFRKVSPAAFAEAFGIALSDRYAVAAIDPDQPRAIEDAEAIVCDALHRALSVFDDDASEGGPARAAFVDYVFPLVLRFRDSAQVSRVKGLWEKWRSVVKVCRGRSKALPARLVEEAEAAGREAIGAARLALSRLFEELHPAKRHIWFVRDRLAFIAKHCGADDPPKGILEAEAEALEALRPLAWGQPGAEEVAATRTALERLSGALAKRKGEEWKNEAGKVRGILKHFDGMPETAPSWFHLPRFDVPDFDFDKIDFTGLSSPAPIPPAPKKKHGGSPHYEVSQKDAAEKLGATVRTIQNWEAGKTKSPGGYCAEKRRSKAEFDVFVAGLLRDMATIQNMHDKLPGVHLGNRRISPHGGKRPVVGPRNE